MAGQDIALRNEVCRGLIRGNWPHVFDCIFTTCKIEKRAKEKRGECRKDKETQPGRITGRRHAGGTVQDTGHRVGFREDDQIGEISSFGQVLKNSHVLGAEEHPM